jgi:predicted dehydrogenase
MQPGTGPEGQADEARRSDDGGGVRVALIGAGFIADYHAAALRDIPDAALVAIIDPDRARAESFAAHHDVSDVRASVDEIGDTGADVAHVLTPPDLHEEFATQCLRAGMHVFVEKPLALSAEAAQRLHRLAEENERCCGVNHNYLHLPAVESLVRSCSAGHIGPIQHVSVLWSTALRELETGATSSWMFRQPGNIVYESAVHPFAIVETLLGAPEHVEVSWRLDRTLPTGQRFVHRWHVHGASSGASVDLVLSAAGMYNTRRVRVVGTDGVMDCDLESGDVHIERPSARHARLDTIGRLGAALVSDAVHLAKETVSTGRQIVAPGQDLGLFELSIARSVDDFYRAMRDGTAPRTTASSASRVLQWCDPVAASVADISAPRPRAVSTSRPGSDPVRDERVAVLGSTGFIGRAVVRSLLNAGVPVTAIARRSFDPSTLEWPESGLDVAIASLDDAEALRQAVEGADVVVQLATGSTERDASGRSSMVDGTMAVAEVSAAAGARAMVFASSIAAFYLGPDAPELVVDDDSPLDPRPDERGDYARGKIAAERALRRAPLPVVTIRPGIVLGRGTPPQHAGLGTWRNSVYCLGWGAGDHPLPIVLVDDVAAAVALIVASDWDDHAAVNLAASAGLSARDVVAVLRQATGRPLEFIARSSSRRIAELQAARGLKRLLGRRSPPSLSRDIRSMEHVVTVRSSTARALGWQPADERALTTTALLDAYAPA